MDILQGHGFRSEIIDGEPWFVATDACRCLGMDTAIGGARQWIVGLDQDEKRLAIRAQHPEIFSGSRAPTLSLISRPGLFKLIQRSNKPDGHRHAPGHLCERPPLILRQHHMQAASRSNRAPAGGGGQIRGGTRHQHAGRLRGAPRRPGRQ